MHISLSAPARMKLCIFLTQARRSLRNNFYIVTWGGLRVSRADIGSASSTCAICAVTMVARGAFTHDLAVYVSVVVFLVSFGKIFGVLTGMVSEKKKALSRTE